jgi:hypothetical protein
MVKNQDPGSEIKIPDLQNWIFFTFSGEKYFSEMFVSIFLLKFLPSCLSLREGSN